MKRVNHSIRIAIPLATLVKIAGRRVAEIVASRAFPAFQAPHGAAT